MASDSLTDFLRDPNKVLKQVDKHDVVIDRRGKPSIVISLQMRNIKIIKQNELASNLLADAVAGLPEIADRFPALLPKRFPWARFLPPAALAQFARELVETIQASASLDTQAPIEELVCAWKATAEIYVDPELAARLKAPVEETTRRVRRP